MKRFLFCMAIILPMVLTTACSSDDSGADNTDSANIEFETNNISVSVNGETNINVSGVNISDCNITEEDDFIVYASTYNNKLNVEGLHVGKTKVLVSYNGKTAECNVEVTPVNDFVASTVTEFGISQDELKEYVEKPYDSYKHNGQTGITDIVYMRSGYKITNSYYWNNNILCGVRKTIQSSDNDTQTLLNVSKSMSERMKFISSSSSTVNSYPRGHRMTSIYQFPNKYYAVYEQTKYDILYETGTNPPTTNIIYYAKDLETAKNHQFVK